MRKGYWAISLLSSSITIGTEAISEESIPVFGSSHNNLRYSQYEIVEDHPTCNAPDEIVFSVPLQIDEVEYAILDPKNNTVVFEGDQIYRECTLTTRRGTELTQRQIPCSDELDSDSDNRLTNAPLSIKFEGNVLACISPSKIRVLETSWAVSSASESEVDGHPASISTNSETIDRYWDSGTRITTSVKIDYIDRFFSSSHFRSSSRDHVLVQALEAQAIILVQAYCIPLISTLSEPLFVEFHARFAPVNEVKQTCTANDCPVPFGSDTFRGYSRTSEGEVRLSSLGVGKRCLRQ